MFSNASRPVAVPRIEFFAMRASSTLKPGRSGVTRKAVISFFFPAEPATPGVLAMTVSTSAMPPLVIHFFEPLRMNPLPSGVGVAVVCTLLASDPASGSVRANAASFSPLTSGTSHCFCCSGVPNSSSARMPIEWCALTKTAVEAQWPPMSSMILTYICWVNARPPTSVGAVMPRTPSLPSPATTSFGMIASRSMAAASMCSSQYLRTSSSDRVGDLALLGGQLRVGEQERRLELAQEQPLGEAQRVLLGEEQFLGLLALLIDLRGSEGHDSVPPRSLGSRVFLVSG